MLYLWGLLAIATVGSLKLHIAKIIRLAHAQASTLNTVPSAFTQTGRYPTDADLLASETTERPITPPPSQLDTSLSDHPIAEPTAPMTFSSIDVRRTAEGALMHCKIQLQHQSVIKGLEHVLETTRKPVSEVSPKEI
jgi:hypothetical protein